MPHHLSEHHCTEILLQAEQYLAHLTSSKVSVEHDKNALPDVVHFIVGLEEEGQAVELHVVVDLDQPACGKGTALQLPYADLPEDGLIAPHHPTRIELQLDASLRPLFDVLAPLAELLHPGRPVGRQSRDLQGAGEGG